MNCFVCDSRAKQISSNIRIMRYYCEDCDLIYRITVHNKYRPENQSEMVLSNNEKYFRLRKLKEITPGVYVIQKSFKFPLPKPHYTFEKKRREDQRI